MTGPSIIRRALQWAGLVFAASIAAVAILAAAVDSGYLRGPFIRLLAARTGREIQIQGRLEAHIFSFSPWLIAERVTIGNPAWVPPGRTAEIGKIALALDLPGSAHGFGVKRLEMRSAALYLVRDSAGHANWQWSDPDKPAGNGIPLIRALSMQGARVELDDARRHLKFRGSVSAEDANDARGLHWLRIDGAGELNGRPASFEVNGEALAHATHRQPYRFTFAEQSSASRLTGHGSLLRPFSFDELDAAFEASGADLKDLYFLTGVTLTNTGSYRLSGKLARRGTNSRFSDLAVITGQSDVRGAVSIDISSGRPKLDGELDSQWLRLADFGARAAGRESAREKQMPLMLSDAAVSPDALRHGDAAVSFHARRVDVGRVPLHAVAAKISIEHGVVVLSSLTAEVLEGKLTARARLDATTDNPPAEVNLQISGLQLGQYQPKSAQQPPFDGLLQARISVKGHGRSIHQIAATANGILTAVIPHGAVRASLAELAGIDFRGLGLALGKKTQETAVRCGVASFQAHDGTLVAQSLVIDTVPVLISGDGVVHLDSEVLDLSLRGQPKGLRLRVRSPLRVRGTLLHPLVGIQPRDSAAQGAAAVALGVLLTPLAAVLAFVDPGLAKDADCGALLASAKSDAAAN